MYPIEAQDSYSLDEFARRNRIGLTTVYSEINAGRLIARKLGRRTLVTVEDARLWRNNLPKIDSGPGAPCATVAA